MKTKIAKKIPRMKMIFKNLVIQMMMRLLMEMSPSKNNQYNHLFRNDLYYFLGMFDPPDVEPDDISEANSQNSFAIGVVEDKEIIELSPTTNAADENFEVISETAYGGRNNEFNISGSGILFETKYLLVRKRHEFHRSKSEKCFVQRFCASTKGNSFSLLYTECAMFPSFLSTANDNYYIVGSIPSPLYQDCLKKTVLLIFQITFVQDSQILLLPQVQTIVIHFWDTTWCVQLLQIIATYANTVKG